MIDIRIGNGYDSHRLVENRALYIGGVQIDFHLGLSGHSDADVLLHAISDALLGSLALGDLGTHFPDSDSKWKNANSALLLQNVYMLIKGKGFKLVNLDATIIAEAPKFMPHIENIRESIAKILESESGKISVKATSNEKMGWLGRGEGIAAIATVLVSREKQ